jgi:hypothetical protein
MRYRRNGFGAIDAPYENYCRRAADRRQKAAGEVDSAAQFVRDYLSREHFEDIDGTCSLIAFPTDFFARGALHSASI